MIRNGSGNNISVCEQFCNGSVTDHRDIFILQYMIPDRHHDSSATVYGEMSSVRRAGSCRLYTSVKFNTHLIDQPVDGFTGMLRPESDHVKIHISIRTLLIIGNDIFRMEPIDGFIDIQLRSGTVNNTAGCDRTSSQAIQFFQDNYFCSGVGRFQRGHQACNTASDHKHICIQVLIFGSLMYLFIKSFRAGCFQGGFYSILYSVGAECCA